MNAIKITTTCPPVTLTVNTDKKFFVVLLFFLILPYLSLQERIANG